MKHEQFGYCPRDHPASMSRKFYAIDVQPDGTADVYLSPVVCVYDTDLGIRETIFRRASFAALYRGMAWRMTFALDSIRGAKAEKSLTFREGDSPRV